MDDEFLTRYRENPRPEFARRLQERMERPMVQKRTARQTLLRWSPALLAASVIVAAVLVLSFPPAQALAQDFLNLFRVKKFAAISVDPARASQLENINLDMEKLFAENVQVVKEPGKPVKMASAQEAGKRAGFNVAVPSALPENAKLEAYVEGEGSMILTLDTEKAQSILDTLGINDVQIPQQLNGAKITVNKPAAVMLKYTLKEGVVALMQSRSPEVDLPPGVNLAQMGEIGLRVLGLNKQEAHDFAQKVDWSSTFLIPIPADAAQVRQVDINGAEGLMVTSNGTMKNGKGPYANGETVILWAKNGMVYAMHANVGYGDLLELANSVQ